VLNVSRLIEAKKQGYLWFSESVRVHQIDADLPHMLIDSKLGLAENWSWTVSHMHRDSFAVRTVSHLICDNWFPAFLLNLFDSFVALFLQFK